MSPLATVVLTVNAAPLMQETFQPTLITRTIVVVVVVVVVVMISIRSSDRVGVRTRRRITPGHSLYSGESRILNARGPIGQRKILRLCTRSIVTVDFVKSTNG